MRRVAICAVLAACQSQAAHERSADLAAAIGDAQRAAIGDLDGDGAAELVLVGPTSLRVLDRAGRELASMPVARGIQLLAIADVDGDGRAELLAGWGISREHMDAGATFTLYRLAGHALAEETVFTPETSRQDVTAIVPMPDAHGVLLAYFASKYEVQAVVATRGPTSWQTAPLGTARMATSYARGDVDGDGKADVVVGRMYGDAQGVDGDAYVLRPDGSRTPIPTTRGLRSLAVAGTDVFFGDGWHQNYGEHAQARLALARYHDGAFTTELVAELPGQYSIDKIVPATVAGRPALVALATKDVRLFQRVDGAWRNRVIGGAARDVAVGDLDGKPGDEVVILGEHPAVVHLTPP